MIKYSLNAQNVINLASDLAMNTGGLVCTEHIMWALSAVDGSGSQRLLNRVGVYRDDLLHLFTPSAPIPHVEMSARASHALENAMDVAIRLRASNVLSEHILYALLDERDSVAAKILMSVSIDPTRLQRLTYNAIVEGSGNRVDFVGVNSATQSVNDILNGYNGAYYNENNAQQQSQNVKNSVQNKDNPSNDFDLSKFGVDLTKKAEDGKLDPVIGRDKETERVIQVLCRRTKNNPILIGEPGVGKSAVIDGLVQAIVAGNVPNMLIGKRVFSLDLSSLVAGTRYRGDFEERLTNALKAIKDSGNIILFIDEIHTILKAGSSEGGLDIANILKPMLARGELTTIGATTLEEYRKQFEVDSALDRRFQPVTVDEPSIEDTIKILTGLKGKYEAHHGVEISLKAIIAAAVLSDRYVQDRFLPDKAVDLIDEAASHKKLYNKTLDGVIAVIDENDIADVVHAWTGIPVAKLNEGESAKLVNLEDKLESRVIGQDDACKAVARAVKRARAGLKDPKRPIGSFIFLGPTGVGKTELAKALAEAMFNDEDMIIRIDMSEYMTTESVARLIGSAPGLVGFEEGGQLTEKVRRKPYSVVLFDEIEKGHPDIFNILLQILEDGILTDSHGRQVSFKNTVIILTSNIGAKEAASHALGFGAVPTRADEERTREAHIDALKGAMKPEIINRIDEIVVFNKLDKLALIKIADIMLNSLSSRLKAKRISLTITNEAKDFIVQEGYDPEFGARPLRRVVSRLLEDVLSEKIIRGEIKEGDKIVASVVDGKIKFLKSK